MYILYKRVPIHFRIDQTTMQQQQQLPCSYIQPIYHRIIIFYLLYGIARTPYTLSAVHIIERKRVEMNLTGENRSSMPIHTYIYIYELCVKVAHKTDSSPPRASMKMWCCWCCCRCCCVWMLCFIGFYAFIFNRAANCDCLVFILNRVSVRLWGERWLINCVELW